MIHTNRIVTVGEQESVIDRPIVLYRGDREVEIEFTLVGNEFMFSTEGNVIKSTNASHGQLVLNTPSGENMFSELAECHEGKVVFVVTKEMIDEFIEIGFYSFQIRLYDSAEMKSRVTIPPVLNGFDIRNPIAAEDEVNVVDQGLVDYARIVKDQSNEELPTFDWKGDYNKTEWEHHDLITENKLNKIEDALYTVSQGLNESNNKFIQKANNMEKEFQNKVNELKADDKQLGDEIDDVNRTINNRIDKLEVDINVGDVAWKEETEEFIESELVDVVHRANYMNVDKYEHLVENDDWTLAVQTALNENDKIVITKHIKIYGTVVIGTRKVVEIGACSVTKPSDATDNGPIFWFRANQSTLRGQGQGSSTVQMNIASPEGAVRIGHSTDEKADTNCLYNQVCDLEIVGGSRDDGVSVSLMMRNAETDGLASYFHTISNIRISRAYMGIALKGYMNANIINNIQLYNAGGNGTGGGICFLGINNKVPMENSICGVFHHASQHACTLLIDCATFYNKITNILSEQGGTNAICLKVTDNGSSAHSNTFATSPNVNQGNTVNETFIKRNMIEGFNNIQIGTVNATNIVTTSLAVNSFDMCGIKSQRIYRNSQSIKENEDVTLLTFNDQTNLTAALCTIKLYIRSSTAVDFFMQVAEQKFKVHEAMGEPIITELDSIGHKLTWSDRTLKVRMPNNGTNTSNFTVWFELEMFGYQWTNITIGEKFTQR